MYNYSLTIAVDGKALGSIMFFMILGIFFASSYTIFIKRFRGDFVLALIDSSAFDESSAKSLEELGIKNTKLRNFIINREFTFTPDYYAVDVESSEDKIKVIQKKYYVNQEHIKRLESKYGNSGITFVQLLITIIAFFAVALVMATAVPDILNMFNL